MASTTPQTTELSLKLRLSREASERLTEQASRSGRDVAEYASGLIEQAVNRPDIDELLAPFRQAVAESGMKDEDLDTFYEDLRQQAWEQRQGRKG